MCRLNQGSLCKLGTTAIEVEARKIEKYCQIIEYGYISQAVVSTMFSSESSERKVSAVDVSIV